MIKSNTGKKLSIFAIFCAGLFLSVAWWYLTYKYEERQVRNLFDDASYYRYKFIEDTLQNNMSALQSFSDFYAASQLVDKNEFSTFAAGIFLRNPSITEFRWLERVRHDERGTFESNKKKEGAADFSIKELDKNDDMVIAAEREEYFPVCYIACSPKNECNHNMIIGLDAGSFPERLEAMQRARDTAKPSVTGEIRLVGEPIATSASRIFLPIYKNGLVHNTVEERRKDLTGYVAMLYQADQMMESSLEGITPAGIDLAIYLERPDGRKLLYFHLSRLRKNPKDPLIEKDLLKRKGGMIWSSASEVADSKWFIVCAPSPEFAEGNRIIRPWISLVVGLFFTIVLTFYFGSIINRSKIIEDLVERRTNELYKAEERYRVLYEFSKDAIMILAPPDWKFISGNPATIKLFKVMDERDFVGRFPWEFSPERQRDGELSSTKSRHMINIAMEKGSHSFEWCHKKLNGEEFSAEVLLSKVESGEEVFVQATVRDVTERKAIEERIARANKEWADTFNSISDFVFILDKESTITKVNKAFLDALKLKEDEVVGKQCYDIVHKRTSPWPTCPHQKTIRDGKPHTEEVFDPAIGLPLLISTSPIVDDSGNFIGTVHIAKDISSIKKTEEEIKKAKEKIEAEARELAKANDGIRRLNKELADANEQLKKLDQLKSDFVSIVSHELRTPITIMKEGVSLVLDNITGAIGEKTRHTLGMVYSNIDRLAKLINDLLDISKIESGKMQVKKVAADVNALVKDTAAKWQMETDKRKQKLIVSAPSDKIEMNIDPDKIVQVLSNLISNAIKFTPENGTIEVGVHDSSDVVEIFVSDSGVGIAKEDLPKVFEKFRQFNRVPGGGAKGTGLGLAISRELVMLHEGTIKVESEKGAGAKFTFTLPKKA